MCAGVTTRANNRNAFHNLTLLNLNINALKVKKERAQLKPLVEIPILTSLSSQEVFIYRLNNKFYV
ncbi:hypothetical protein GCM10007978_30150 [Shewanella hanedai]|nr:hypothetical protein GCM10007978_30150 [Shewanella hanedai]